MPVEQLADLKLAYATFNAVVGLRAGSRVPWGSSPGVSAQNGWLRAAEWELRSG